MKKLILTSLFATAVFGVATAQKLLDFTGPGNVTSTSSTPYAGMGDDLSWTIPNGLANVHMKSINVGTWNRDTVNAQTPFALVRFYDTVNMAATGTALAMENVTNSFTIAFPSIAANTANSWTITGSAVEAMVMSPANTKGWSIEFFTDSTMTTRMTLMSTFLSTSYQNGVPFPVGTSALNWFRDVENDGIWQGANIRNFAAPSNTLALWLDFVPKGTNISGTIILQDWVPPTTGKAVSYELRDAGANVVYSGTVALDVAGAYTAIIPDTIPAGTYDMAFKGATWLFKKNSVTIDGVTPIIGNDYSLLNGNSANADQTVDLSDYTKVVTAFNALLVDPNNGGLPSANWDVLADLNGDGGVDLTDYTVVVSNFNALGD